LWEGPNRKAIGPISWRPAEADAIAFAARHQDRRISLREIALSYETYGNRLVSKQLFRLANAFVGEPYSHSEWADCEALCRS